MRESLLLMNSLLSISLIARTPPFFRPTAIFFRRFFLLARYLEITPSPQPRSKIWPSFGKLLSISSRGRIAFLKKSYKTIYLILRIILAGTPPTKVLAGTSFLTTLLAATKDSLPTIIPGKIIEHAPITDPLLKTTGFENLGKYLCREWSL